MMSIYKSLGLARVFQCRLAQSARAADYTDCICAERVTPPPYKCLGYDSKLSDDEAPVMLKLWGMRSTPSLPSLTGPI